MCMSAFFTFYLFDFKHFHPVFLVAAVGWKDVHPADFAGFKRGTRVSGGGRFFHVDLTCATVQMYTHVCTLSPRRSASVSATVLVQSINGLGVN